MSRARPVAVAAGFLVVLGVAVDLVIGETSPFPGYAAAIGLFGCIAIILVYKWLAGAVLGRPEDYYPDDVPPDVHGDLAARQAADGDAPGRQAGAGREDERG